MVTATLAKAMVVVSEKGGKEAGNLGDSILGCEFAILSKRVVPHVHIRKTPHLLFATFNAFIVFFV